jgi:hypothetical protein
MPARAYYRVVRGACGTSARGSAYDTDNRLGLWQGRCQHWKYKRMHSWSAAFFPFSLASTCCSPWLAAYSRWRASPVAAVALTAGVSGRASRRFGGSSPGGTEQVPELTIRRGNEAMTHRRLAERSTRGTRARPAQRACDTRHREVQGDSFGGQRRRHVSHGWQEHHPSGESQYGPVTGATGMKGEQQFEITSILDQRHTRRLLPSRGRASPRRGVDALLDR